MNRQIRSSQVSSTRTGIARLAIVLCAVLFASQLAALSPAAAASPLPVPLGSAGAFSVLGATGVTSTGATVIEGDLGLSPLGVIAGFGPGEGVVQGTIHDKDLVAAAAQFDRLLAYTDAASRTPTAPDFAGDQIGNTFAPGVHHSSGAFANTGAMTLNAGGDPNAVFIFQIGAAFSPAAGSSIVLDGDARADNVFWQILGAVSIPAGASYAGTFLVQGAFTLGAGDALEGRALSAGAVTLANNHVTLPLPVDVTDPTVSIDGGATALTNDSTPTISGTASEPAGTPVTVSGIGSAMTTTVTGTGTWTVNQTTPVADSTYTVLASVTDAAGNTGTATQSLTVDTTAPTVAISGGENASTSDPTPTISGTTTGAVGRTLTVSGIGSDMTVTVAGDGSWSVTPATAVADATYTVTASVTDLAGNTGTDTQALTVDTDAVEPAPRYRPDASIRLPGGRWVGVGVYGRASQEQIMKKIRRQGTSATFVIRATNRGNTADRIKVRGTSTTDKFRVSFRADGKNVTRAVVAGTYRTRSLAPGKSVRLVVKVIRTEVPWFGNKKTFRVRTTSSHAWRKRDAVAAVVASFPRR